MSYLILEMLFFLLVTAVLGILVGWAAKALLASRRHRADEATWRQELRRSDARAGNLKSQLAEAFLVEERLREELSQAEATMVDDVDPEKVQSLEAELSQRDKKIALLKLQLTQSEASLASEWESLKALKLEIADRQRRLDERGKQVSGKLRSSEETQQQLRLQHRSMKRQVERQQEELAAARQALVAERQASGARIAELKSKLEEKETLIALLSAEEEKSTEDTRVEAPAIEAPVTEAPRPEAPAPQTSADDPPAEGPAPEEPSADDLQRIRGIGPVLRRKLNDSGITRFRQIAAWTDGEIVEIAQQIGVGAGRIRSGGWIESARALVGDPDDR